MEVRKGEPVKYRKIMTAIFLLAVLTGMIFLIYDYSREGSWLFPYGVEDVETEPPVEVAE